MTEQASGDGKTVAPESIGVPHQKEEAHTKPKGKSF